MNDALLETLHGRHNEMIDPSLHIWGWEIPVYLFLGGVVAGMLVLSAALELSGGKRPRSRAIRLAPFVALVLLSVGMLALFLDLDHKFFVWRFYLAFEPTSPMSWGSWILLLVYPVGLLLGLGSLDARERSGLLGWALVGKLRLRSALEWVLEGADGWRNQVLWGAVVAGVALGVYTGLLLGTLSARPQWDTAVLGPLFLSSGLSTGAACLLLFSLDPEERHWLVRWDLVAIGAELFFLGAMLVGFATGDRAAQHALHNLTAGEWGGPFWVLVVLLGLVVPVTFDALEIRRRLPPLRLTPALILIGGLSLRWILVDSGQASNFSAFP